VNGNGKNQINDNDNGKQYSTRLVFGLSKKYNFNVGLNGGIGEVFSKKVYAVGVDLSSLINLILNGASICNWKLNRQPIMYFTIPSLLNYDLIIRINTWYVGFIFFRT
jgi:hypothetical protein